MMDPSTVWVRVNLDESLLGEVRWGQRPEITVRSSPARTFAGKVVRIGQQSEQMIPGFDRVASVKDGRLLIEPNKAAA
jgi:multidrug resistance efflux pump